MQDRTMEIEESIELNSQSEAEVDHSILCIQSAVQDSTQKVRKQILVEKQRIFVLENEIDIKRRQELSLREVTHKLEERTKEIYKNCARIKGNNELLKNSNDIFVQHANELSKVLVQKQEALEDERKYLKDQVTKCQQKWDNHLAMYSKHPLVPEYNAIKKKSDELEEYSKAMESKLRQRQADLFRMKCERARRIADDSGFYSLHNFIIWIAQLRIETTQFEHEINGISREVCNLKKELIARKKSKALEKEILEPSAEDLSMELDTVENNAETPRSFLETSVMNLPATQVRNDTQQNFSMPMIQLYMPTFSLSSKQDLSSRNLAFTSKKKDNLTRWHNSNKAPSAEKQSSVYVPFSLGMTSKGTPLSPQISVISSNLRSTQTSDPIKTNQANKNTHIYTEQNINDSNKLNTHLSAIHVPSVQQESNNDQQVAQKQVTSIASQLTNLSFNATHFTSPYFQTKEETTPEPKRMNYFTSHASNNDGNKIQSNAVQHVTANSRGISTISSEDHNEVSSATTIPSTNAARILPSIPLQRSIPNTVGRSFATSSVLNIPRITSPAVILQNKETKSTSNQTNLNLLQSYSQCSISSNQEEKEFSPTYFSKSVSSTQEDQMQSPLSSQDYCTPLSTQEVFQFREGENTPRASSPVSRIEKMVEDVAEPHTENEDAIRKKSQEAAEKPLSPFDYDKHFEMLREMKRSPIFSYPSRQMFQSKINESTVEEIEPATVDKIRDIAMLRSMMDVVESGESQNEGSTIPILGNVEMSPEREALSPFVFNYSDSPPKVAEGSEKSMFDFGAPSPKPKKTAMFELFGSSDEPEPSESVSTPSTSFTLNFGRKDENASPKEKNSFRFLF